MKQKQCKCGGTEFTAHQKSYHDVIVNGHNIFLEDKGSYDSDNPYGPYRCMRCDTEYEELIELVEVEANDRDTKPSEAEPVTIGNRIFRYGQVQSTIHIQWWCMETLVSDLLTDILGRSVEAYAKREDYYYWNISFAEPISEDELDALCKFVQAIEEDTDIYGDNLPINELTESLSNKLMGKLMPFELTGTRADDDGIWFMGKAQHDTADTNPATEPMNTLELALPNGMSFTAKIGGDIPYPGIYIYLKQPDGSEDNICYAEYNSSREEHRRICVSAYAHNIDEPTYYASYHDDGVPWE